MFLAHFKAFFSALNKAPLVAIIAFLMAAIVGFGIYHGKAMTDKDDDCRDLRSDDKERIKELTKILTLQQGRMMDAILKETVKETAKNDSIIRKQVENEINTIMP